MEAADLQKQILDAYGIRVEPNMAAYVLRQLQQAGGALRALPVIGGNARTGVPVRMSIDAAKLALPPSSAGVS
jgi:hypothetical protein